MEFQDSMISKLLLMFVMEKMEMPLSESTIIDICTTQNDWLNYMECKDILYQLLKADFICIIKGHDGEEKYAITIEGQGCLEHFYTKISKELQEEVLDFVKKNRMHLKKSQEYVADYSKNSDGTYLLVLKIRSDTINYPMFEVKIATYSRQAAIDACKKWRENAHILYEQVFETLIDTENN